MGVVSMPKSASSGANAKRLISGAIVPLVPLAVGIILKLGFIDSVPEHDRYGWMIENYGRSMWIDLVVTAYILAAGVLLTVKPNISPDTKKSLLYVPSGAFIVNILFSLAFPKFGLRQNLWTVWIPAGVGYISLFWVGFLVTGINTPPVVPVVPVVSIVPAVPAATVVQPATAAPAGEKR